MIGNIERVKSKRAGRQKEEAHPVQRVEATTGMTRGNRRLKAKKKQRESPSPMSAMIATLPPCFNNPHPSITLITPAMRFALPLPSPLSLPPDLVPHL